MSWENNIHPELIKRIKQLQAIAKADALWAENKCHICEAPIEPSTIVGRCKYGACGHRIGQVARGETHDN